MLLNVLQDFLKLNDSCCIWLNQLALGKEKASADDYHEKAYKIVWKAGTLTDSSPSDLKRIEAGKSFLGGKVNTAGFLRSFWLPLKILYHIVIKSLIKAITLSKQLPTFPLFLNLDPFPGIKIKNAAFQIYLKRENAPPAHVVTQVDDHA